MIQARSMTVGTCHFIDFEAAVKYYWGYYAHIRSYVDQEAAVKSAVHRKRNEREIVIGRPPQVQRGETLYLVDGRYHIITVDETTPAKAA